MSKDELLIHLKKLKADAMCKQQMDCCTDSDKGFMDGLEVAIASMEERTPNLLMDHETESNPQPSTSPMGTGPGGPVHIPEENQELNESMN